MPLSRTKYSVLSFLLVATVVLVACNGEKSGDSETSFDPETSLISSFDFSSPAFDDGSQIPFEYTCDGEESSPPLRWGDPPNGTRALAIVVDDPDAPGTIFRHWSVYNVPSGMRSLPEDQSQEVELKDSTRQGENHFGDIGYGGPCPPSGESHEYSFFIYALTAPLELTEPASPEEVSKAIRGNVIGIGSFTGMYARQ